MPHRPRTLRLALLALVAPLLIVAACAHRPQPGAAAQPGVPEDSVFHAVLTAEAERLARGERLYVARDIRAQFASEGEARSWAESSPLAARVPPNLALAYALANTRPRTVGITGTLAGHGVVLADAPAGDQRSSRTVHQLSRVGFSANGDSAVVMVTRTCGALCGSTSLLLGVREPAGWRVARELWTAVH